jgi:hypothetical protein
MQSPRTLRRSRTTYESRSQCQTRAFFAGSLVEALLYFSGGLLIVLAVAWFIESGALRGPESLRSGITRQLKASSDLLNSIQSKL